MQVITQIENNEVYKEVMKDSFGGVMYNVANQNKYDTTEIMALWDSLTPVQQSSAGGIIKGAFSFLKGDEV